MTDDLRVAICKWRMGVRVISMHEEGGRTSVKFNGVEISPNDNLCDVLDGVFTAIGEDVDIECMRSCDYGRDV